MSYTNGLDKPSDYFNTVLYTGNGGGTRSITGTGFQPDLVWNKDRSDPVGYPHFVFDAVRGAGVEKEIITNSTNAEGAYDLDNYGYISSFDSDGFTTTIGAVNNGYFNNSGTNYVSWHWLANGAGSSNTDGSITSTVSANTTSGFSIATYAGNSTAGATIGHGLNAVPSMVIVKSTSNAESWAVYHKDVTTANNYYLYLNTTGGLVTTGGDRWSVGSNSSTLFGLGNDGTTNSSGKNYVAYCFAEKKGFSKFGSYTGNGSADGTFVYTGFKPKYVLTKRTDGSYIWSITDGVRNPYNPTSLTLQTEYADAESGWSPLEVDFLSNGFKLRTSSAQKNGSGSPFIYMAFAEFPTVSSTGTPVTAR